MSQPVDLKRKLQHAINDGTEAARMELGIARMAQLENGEGGRCGKWYAGIPHRPPVVIGERRRFSLLGEEFTPDGVKRQLVDTLGEAQEYESHRRAMGACALQGDGAVPIHEREAVRLMPDTVVLEPSTRGLER